MALHRGCARLTREVRAVEQLRVLEGRLCHPAGRHAGIAQQPRRVVDPV